jgi:hypothetical protein
MTPKTDTSYFTVRVSSVTSIGAKTHWATRA